MVTGSKPLQSFEQLIVWQESQNLAVMIYELTRKFPKDEIYALTSQIRRAATSVSANIAEGFGRSSVADKVHFATMAYGSLLEVKNFLYLSEKLTYITSKQLEPLIAQVTSCQKLLNAYKKATK